MTLASGNRVGSYEILAAIGAGGMGEVYRARDAKLGRDVALKILPEAFARDAEHMARFQREAKVLASLNHPNIATIHGLEDSGPTHALVMELVEGPTLADRIRSGPIPIGEALRIAKQITDALEYAHERGIVHRDLKPANVKVTSDDTVKILDFGLAKAVGGEVSAPSHALRVTGLLRRMENLLEGDTASADIANSPTFSEITTRPGILLGTAAYMSPEQAKGKAVDRRADIWAFGCVLYEMVTGEMAFRGESVTDTLAAVIKEEPDWSQLRAATPIRVRVLLQRCLQKDPKQRLRDIGDARIALDEVLIGAPDEGTQQTTVPRWRQTGLLVLTALAAAAIAALVLWHLTPSPSRPVTRAVIALQAGLQLAGLDQPALALSPDGSQLAYVAAPAAGGQQQIYLRAMDSSNARPMKGTEGAVAPFFSPDGRWMGFFAGGKLKKISVRGGVAQILTDVVNPSGATWGSEHTIVVAPYSSVLQQVSDEGGAPQPLTRFEAGETTHTWPEFLPGSKAVLFTALSAGPPAIAIQPIGAGERRNLIQGQGEGMARYAPSGHLIYAQAGNLVAVPFDIKRLEVTGDAVPIVQGVLQSPDSGAAQYSVSATGSLVYVPGNPQSATPLSRLVWVSRDGREQPLDAPARSYNQPRLSPDGGRVAVDVVENLEQMQVWLYDLARGTLAPFTFEGVNRHAVWMPDGRRIAFMSNREGPTQIFWQSADGGGVPERLTNIPATTTADILPIPYSWSPDGELLAFAKVAPTKGAEFWVLNVRDHKAERFLQTRTAGDGAPQFSPDGRWLAYASGESGRLEIYVQPYPGPGGKWQISTDGGNEPQWNHNGRELFYRNGEKMMAVDVSTHAGFAVGRPRLLFEGRYVATVGGYSRANYDVSADGQRFLMLKPVEQGQTAPAQISLVLNWFEELKRKVPVGEK
jgi:eukaryotic-like serine/threonine-protein kinase